MIELVSANLLEGQRLQSVRIISINGQAVTGTTNEFFPSRRLASRRLDQHVYIEYEIILEELCGTGDCNDAQEAANKLYDSVTSSMQQNIDSGVFEQMLEQSAAELNVILDASVLDHDFEHLIVQILALLSSWYPTFTQGQYCENDGGERELLFWSLLVMSTISHSPGFIHTYLLYSCIHEA